MHCLLTIKIGFFEFNSLLSRHCAFIQFSIPREKRPRSSATYILAYSGDLTTNDASCWTRSRDIKSADIHIGLHGVALVIASLASLCNRRAAWQLSRLGSARRCVHASARSRPPASAHRVHVSNLRGGDDDVPSTPEVEPFASQRRRLQYRK